MSDASSALVKPLLGELRRLFEAAVQRVAALCAVDGALDAGQLDVHQPLCYELALAAAELLAAETAIDKTEEGATAVDGALARLFAFEAITAVLARLDSVYADAGMDGSALHALAASDPLAALRRHAASHAVVAGIGRQVAEDSAEIGRVQLDDDATMARDAFRRFAADVGRAAWPRRSTATT